MDFNKVGHGTMLWLRIDEELALLAFTGD